MPRRCGPHPLPAKRETRQLPSDNNRVLRGDAEKGTLPALGAGPDPTRCQAPRPTPARWTAFLFPGTCLPGGLGGSRAASTRTALPARAWFHGERRPWPRRLRQPCRGRGGCSPSPPRPAQGRPAFRDADLAPQSPGRAAGRRKERVQAARGPACPSARPRPARGPPAAGAPGHSRSRARGGLLGAAMPAARCGLARSLRPPAPGLASPRWASAGGAGGAGRGRRAALPPRAPGGRVTRWAANGRPRRGRAGPGVGMGGASGSRRDRPPGSARGRGRMLGPSRRGFSGIILGVPHGRSHDLPGTLHGRPIEWEAKRPGRWDMGERDWCLFPLHGEITRCPSPTHTLNYWSVTAKGWREWNPDVAVGPRSVPPDWANFVIFISPWVSRKGLCLLGTNSLLQA